MAKLIARYRHPDDPAAFDHHYFNVHVPLARQLPGPTGYEVNRGDVGGGAWHLAAILTFRSFDAMTAALESEIGHAAHHDLANFAGAGVEVSAFDTPAA